MSSVKTLSITGNAAADYNGGVGSGRKRRGGSRKRGQNGDSNSGQVKVNHTGGAAVNLQPLPLKEDIPPPIAIPNPLPHHEPPPVHGGAYKKEKEKEKEKEKDKEKEKEKGKVVLEPAKKQMHVALHKSKSQTRKQGKKIRVSLAGLSKRITRHKSIQKDANKIGLEQIKKTLVDAKLIKADTKAPEKMLRQMYLDYLTLKNKAL